MRFIQPTNILTISVSVALLLLGQFCFINFFHFVEPTIPGISFQIIEKAAPLKTSILFSLTLALIPLLLLTTWRFGTIVSFRTKTLSVIATISFIAIAILLRHQAVKTYFIRVVKPIVAPNGTTNVNYPIDPVRFVYYMFSGLLLGCIVTYFLFRHKKKKA